MFLRNMDIKATQQIINCIRTYNKASSALNVANGNNNHNKNQVRDNLFEVALENINVKKLQDWDKVKKFLLDNKPNNRGEMLYTSENMDGPIMASLLQLNRLDLARSYLKYLQGKGTRANLATTGSYLKLLHQNNKDKISEASEKEIINICNDIRRNYPVLESRTMERMVLALSLTSEWKKCIAILEEIKKTANISALGQGALISAAFSNNEEELAWELLHELLASGKSPLSSTFLSYLNNLSPTKQNKKENVIKHLDKLFTFFMDTETHCNEDVVNAILKSYHLGHISTVTFSGQCNNCKTKLKKLELTDDEFRDLKEVFLKAAIVGKDIFLKSNPDEMKKFEEFIGNMKKYDVVLDGLNVAYSGGIRKGPFVYSSILASVVSHFVQQNKSVLMLGRAHMNGWPQNNWKYIKQNADIFLTQNISEDDPYLLYCALHSGKNTIIVTKDLMRGHRFALKEEKYKILFNRWLSQRQYIVLNVNERGKVFFRVPPHFSAVAQKNGNVWHIPYVPEVDKLENEAYHKTWFCLDCHNN